MNTDIKNSTSMTNIFALHKEYYTYGDKYERPAELFLYNPQTSTFEEVGFYTRIRDAYRALFNISDKNGKPAKLVYIQ